jgi:hypothetical protein
MYGQPNIKICILFIAILNIPALTGCPSGCRHSYNKVTVLGMTIQKTFSTQTPPNKYWQDGTDKHDATELKGSYPTDLPSSVTREHGHCVSTSVVPVTSFKFYLTSWSKFMFWSVILAGRCKKLDAKLLWCGGQLSEPSYAISVGDGTCEGNNLPILVIGGVWRWTLTPF